jgi:phosphopantetheine adenylyltransferase
MTFTPNTITYAIPETDAMFSWVSRAPFGMVVHIEYTDHGSTDNMLNVSPVSLSQAYGLVKRGQQAGLFMLTPTLSGKTVSLSIDTRFIEKELSKLSDLAGRCPSSVPGAATLMRFINDMVRDNTSMLKRVIAAQNGQAFFGMYYDYLNKKQIGSADKSLEPLFDAYVIAASLKMAIVSALNEFGTVIGRNFIKTGDTYKPTNPEGFVLMPSGSGAVKLVDRFEFSRLNFINNALREDVPLTEALALADVNLTVGHKTATIVVGRFTVLTKAHLELMNRAAHLSADMVVVCIVMGEKTSLDTDRNPTSFDMRKEMIDASFSLPHRTVKVTSSFIGELVSVCRDADVEPKYIVIGPDRREEMTKQVDTFKKDLKLTIQVKGQDTVLGPQYRASNVRAAIRNDDVETFKKLTPVGEWKLWSKLRKVV